MTTIDGGTPLALALGMLHRRPLVIALATLLLTACGGSTSDGSGGSGASSGSGGSGGGSGSGTTGGSGGSGGTQCESFVPCCDGQGNAVDPVCNSRGMPECPPGSSFPATGLCSAGACSKSQPCGSNEYCDYPDDRCGEGMDGTCKPRPQGCGLLYAPVCACNGSVAGNSCSAMASGSDVNKNGTCSPPEDTFSCGDVFCAYGTEYCLRGVSDVGGEPDSYSCHVIPTGCSPASCGCMTNEPCGQWCDAAADGSITLTCPGG